MRSGAAWFVALLVAAGLLGWAWGRPAPLRAGPVRVVVVCTDSAVDPFARAVDRLLASDPAAARRLDLVLRAPSTTPRELPLPPCDHLLVERLDARWVEAHAAALASRSATLAFGPAGKELGPEVQARLGLVEDPEVERSWNEGGLEAVERILRLLLARAGVPVEVPPHVPVPQAGLIWFGRSTDRPGAGGGAGLDARGDARVAADWGALEALAGPALEGPRVAILEFPARARRDALAVPRALARALAARGLVPVVAFAQPGSAALRALLLDAAGRPRVDCVIALGLKFVDGDAAAALGALDVPCIDAIRIHGRTAEQWRASTQGLTSGEVAWQLAVPELSGVMQPTVVGAPAPGAAGQSRHEPIPERVERAAERAAAWSRLRRTPPAARRVAVLYWNYPPGKQNVGASYLNVARSFGPLLARLARDGVDVGPEDPARPEVAARLGDECLARGRNVARWAPGELEALVAAGDVVTIPLAEYEGWFATLPPAFRRSVIEHWGPPAAADIMTIRRDGELAFVLPVVRRGRVLFLPQPDRARTQDLAALYQRQDLPPHHQYVACYLWLQRGFAAHALVHTGTHGTHEWLSGKESGLSGDDPSEVLAGGLPIIYPYIMDDVGEGLVAKRRGAGVVVDHLTPALGTSALQPELEALRARAAEWRAAEGAGDPRARDVAVELEGEVVKRGLDVDLRDAGWSPRPDGAWAGDLQARVAALEDHLEETRARLVPRGLHTFGVAPAGERLEGFVAALASAHGAAVASGARAALRASGPRELDMLAAGLAGRFVPPGPGNDPIRDPTALPTGNDFFAFDPRGVPGPRQEALGARLASDLVARLTRELGRPPRRIALQLWGTEAIRHGGVQEGQALALLGVRPARDPQGRITGVTLVPREALGRPRVDVVLHATSLYRDQLPLLIELLDQAVRLAATSPEADNPLAARAQALVPELVRRGLPEGEARRRALVRVFAEPSGMHDSKIAGMAGASGSWDQEGQVADTWITRMGHGYGGGLWGAAMEQELRAALSGTDAIVHTRASNLYATLDNDDYFSYGGSIALGVRRVDGGASPPFLVTDLRSPGAERHVTLERFMGQELRSRYLSPDWIRELQREGYAGARHAWRGVEHLWGWQVVYPEAVGAAKWQEVFETWVDDRHGLGLEAFFDEHAPHARQAIAARLLEVARKEAWAPDDATLRRLAEVYLTSVADDGVSCDSLTCDDPALQAFVGAANARLRAVSSEVAARAKAAVEGATGRTVEAALEQRVADLRRWHDPARREPARVAQRAAAGPTQVQGRRLVEVSRQERPSPSRLSASLAPALLLCLAALGAGAARGARL